MKALFYSMRNLHLVVKSSFLQGTMVAYLTIGKLKQLKLLSIPGKILGKLSQKTFIPKNYRQSFEVSNPNWRAKKSSEGKLNKKCRPVKMIWKVSWRLWKRSMTLRLRLWGDKWKNYKSRRNRYPKTQLRLTRAHRRYYFCTKVMSNNRQNIFL